MLLGAIRFTKGCVRFCAWGKSPERLLNLAAQRGVLLWNVRPTAKGLEASAAARDYRRIRPLARQTSVQTRLLKKRGLPFLMRQYRRRTGLVFGAALGAALLIFLSQFIWTVDLTGQEHISEARLRGLLSENGVRSGALRKSVDVEEVRRSVLLQTEELSWMSVNIVGCHVNVEMKEKDKKPEMDKSGVPCNLKARADGVITGMTVAEGTAQVKKGSGVRQGDLLVSGMSPAGENNVRCVRAKGRVMADVIAEKEFFVPESFRYISITENKADRSCLCFLNLRLPCTLSFTRFDSAVCTTRSTSPSVNGTALPMGVIRETAHELVPVTVTPDKACAERLLAREQLLWELFDRGEGRIVSKETAVTAAEGGYCCRARCVFNENIAESVDFSVEEGYN